MTFTTAWMLLIFLPDPDHLSIPPMPLCGLYRPVGVFWCFTPSEAGMIPLACSDLDDERADRVLSQNKEPIRFSGDYPIDIEDEREMGMYLRRKGVCDGCAPNTEVRRRDGHEDEALPRAMR